MWARLFSLSALILLIGLSTAENTAASSSEMPAVHVVQPGETLSAIALRYGLSVTILAQRNDITNPNLIYSGQVLRLTTAAVSQAIHVVQPGESLSLIGTGYGIPWTQIQLANSLINPHLIEPGQRLVIPAAEPAPTPLPTGPRRIIVSLSEQRAYAYAGDQLVHTFVVSTGRPGQQTAVGRFYIQNKLPVAHAYTWGLQMEYWLGIYYAGHLQNGFHALPIQPDGSRLWAGYLGRPVSYGCIILSVADAATLYAWAEVGDEVIIRQ